MLKKTIDAQNLAWARGDCTSIETLIHDLSQSELSAELLMNLICNEVRLREESGDEPTLDEYQRRFPQLTEELRVQWEIDALLSSRLGPGRAEHQESTSGDAPELKFAGRYEIRGEIGRGAMGVVYEAYDPHLKRTLALKRLRAGDGGGPDELQRIIAEAEVVAQLNHPNVVQLFDIGWVQGSPFLVMEYCRGGTLADFIRGKSLDIPIAVDLMIQIASGVAAAHVIGIVHRDLKPANVMLDGHASLKPKVSDFGLAKRLGSDSHATASGSLVGSPAYMPPEQAMGTVRDIGPAADVYSLGAVLYECLTGRPPFGGKSWLETLDQVRHSEPISVRQLEPGVPIDLNTIVHKCLRKNALHRYANAGELAEDLKRFANREPILARREGWLETGVRIFRRYPVGASLATITLLLLLLLAAGALVVARRESALRRDAQLGQADAMVGRAHGIRLSRRSGQRFEALAAIRQAAQIGRTLNQPQDWFDPLRDEAIAALMLPDLYVEKWHATQEKPVYADFSDDHQLIAVSYAELNEVIIRRFEDFTELGRIARPTSGSLVRFVDSKTLFLKEGNDIELWDLSRTPFQKMWRVESCCTAFNLSNDGQHLAVLDAQWIRILETRTGRELARLPARPYVRDSQVALHPTEPLIACWSYLNAFVEIRNWQTGQTLHKLQPGEGSTDDECYTGADWSPDGRRLFILSGHGHADHWYQYDQTSQHLELIESHRPARTKSSGGAVLRFNATGDRIFARSWAPVGSEIFDALANDSLFAGGNFLLLGGGYIPLLPRIDPDEKFAGLGMHPDGSAKIGLVKVAAAREAKLISRSSRTPIGKVIDPSNRFALAVDPDILHVIDAQTGRSLLNKTLKGIDIQSICFDRSGSFFINGQSGSYRWPYKFSTSTPVTLELGVPEIVHMPYGNVILSCSDDGRTVMGGAHYGFGTLEYAGCWIKTASEPAAQKVLNQMTGNSCCVSPDGRYVAGTPGEAIIWDCQTQPTSIARFPNCGPPRFSRDGKLLLTGMQLVDTSTWKATSKNYECMPEELSDDGSLMLFASASGAVGLAETHTGKTLAHFESLEAMRSPCFTADQTAFTCYTKEGRMLVDLRRIRRELAKDGLDWNAPADDKPESPSSDAPGIESATLPQALESLQTVDELADFVADETLRRAERTPGDPYAAFSAAMVQIERHEYARAMSCLDRAAELLPSSRTVRLWRAYLFAAMQDFQRALSETDDIQSQISISDLRYLRAEWLIQVQRYDDAIKTCFDIMHGGGTFPYYIFSLRAKAYEKLGKHDLSQADLREFEKYTQLDEVTLNAAMHPLVGPDISLRSPIAALDVMRKIQSLNADLPVDAEYAMVRVLYYNELYSEAIERLESSLKEPGNVLEKHNLILLAMASHQAGAIERAEELLARADALAIDATLDFRYRRGLKILRAECRQLLQK